MTASAVERCDACGGEGFRLTLSPDGEAQVCDGCLAALTASDRSEALPDWHAKLCIGCAVCGPSKSPPEVWACACGQPPADDPNRVHRAHPSVGEIRVLPGHDDDAVDLIWPASIERPEIRMSGSHVWTGTAWLPLTGGSTPNPTDATGSNANTEQRGEPS